MGLYGLIQNFEAWSDGVAHFIVRETTECPHPHFTFQWEVGVSGREEFQGPEAPVERQDPAQQRHLKWAWYMQQVLRLTHDPAGFASREACAPWGLEPGLGTLCVKQKSLRQSVEIGEPQPSVYRSAQCCEGQRGRDGRQLRGDIRNSQSPFSAGLEKVQARAMACVRLALGAGGSGDSCRRPALRGSPQV